MLRVRKACVSFFAVPSGMCEQRRGKECGQALADLRGLWLVSKARRQTDRAGSSEHKSCCQSGAFLGNRVALQCGVERDHPEGLR